MDMNKSYRNFEAQKESMVNTQRPFEFRDSNDRRYNANSNKSEMRDSDESHAPNYDRDSAYMENCIPAQSYQNKDMEQDKLTLVKTPNTAKEFRDREIVSCRPSVNANATAFRGKTNGKKFPNRKNATAIENEAKRERESDEAAIARRKLANFESSKRNDNAIGNVKEAKTRDKSRTIDDKNISANRIRDHRDIQSEKIKEKRTLVETK